MSPEVRVIGSRDTRNLDLVVISGRFCRLLDAVCSKFCIEKEKIFRFLCKILYFCGRKMML